MSLPAFKGTITNNIWNGEPLIQSPSPFVTVFPPGITGAIKTYNPFTENITWDTTVPTELNNVTLTQINQLNLNYQMRIDYVYTITSGNQFFISGGIPTINLQIYQPDVSIVNLLFTANLQTKNTLGGGANTTTYCSQVNPNDCPSTTFSQTITNSTFPDPSDYFIQVNPWNNGARNYNVTNFTLEVVANISLFVSCQTPEELESEFCLNLCSQPDNQALCYPQYRQFCLVESGSDGNINLFTNESCDTFIKQYLSTQGPQADVDNLINGACAQFTDVDEFNAQDTTVRDICACHLPQDIYDNLRNTLIQEFPGFQYVDENERCLFPQCPSSSYKISVPIGRTCALPKCINIASINNNGTIKGGAQINQDSRCQSAKNQTGNNAGQPVEETKSWLEKHWVWLVLGLGVLVVLIIVILIILASEGNKKKPKKL